MRRVALATLLCSIGLATTCGCSITTVDNEKSELTRLLNESKYSETITFCNEKLKTDPSNSFVLGYRGVAERHLSKYADALTDLQKAIAIDGKVGWYYRELAEVYAGMHKNREAIQALLKAKELMPTPTDSAYVESFLASIYQRCGEQEKAVAEATASLKIRPDQLYTFLARSYAYVDMFEFDKALADANSALAISKENTDALLARARVYLELGEWQKGIADVNAALAVNPKLWQAMEILSGIYFARGDSELALKKTDEMIKTFPEIPAGYVDKATFLFGTGEFEQAQATVDKALSIDPNNDRANQVVLVLTAHSGDRKKFESIHKRMSEVGMSERRIARGEAMGSLFMRDYSKVVEILSRSIEKYARAPLEYRIRAEAYLRMKKPDLAKADMKKAEEHGYLMCNIIERYMQVDRPK